MKTKALARLLHVHAVQAEAPRVGTQEWFLTLDHAQQKDYLVKNPGSGFHEVHSEKKWRKAAAKKGVNTKAKKKGAYTLGPRTGVVGTNLYKPGDTYTYTDGVAGKKMSGTIKEVINNRALIDIGDGITTEVELPAVTSNATARLKSLLK